MKNRKEMLEKKELRKCAEKRANKKIKIFQQQDKQEVIDDFNFYTYHVHAFIFRCECGWNQMFELSNF